MVQEVESFDTELNLSALTHLEVLEQRQITRPVPGAEEFRQNERTVRARSHRQSKAVSIDVLIVVETASRVAGHNRRQWDLIRTVDGLSIDWRIGKPIICVQSRSNISSDIEVTMCSV